MASLPCLAAWPGQGIGGMYRIPIYICILFIPVILYILCEFLGYCLKCGFGHKGLASASAAG